MSMTIHSTPTGPEHRPESHRAATRARLNRYRMRVERVGLGLRVGEVVLGMPFAPTPDRAVVIVRREAEDRVLGTLVSRAEVEYSGHTEEPCAEYPWAGPAIRN